MFIVGSIKGFCSDRSRPALPVDLEVAHLVLDFGLEQKNEKDEERRRQEPKENVRLRDSQSIHSQLSGPVPGWSRPKNCWPHSRKKLQSGLAEIFLLSGSFLGIGGHIADKSSRSQLCQTGFVVLAVYLFSGPFAAPVSGTTYLMELELQPAVKDSGTSQSGDGSATDGILAV